MLALRRAFSSQTSEREEQRENIFHSRCIAQGKVRMLIINGDSCANVISLSMIEKVNLHTSAHPRLYNFQWLQESKALQVNSRCLISSSIRSNYQYELWFDAILMDACHILLGRPWLFDQKVMYKGYLNTYYFSKDGEKVILAPLGPSQIH